MEFQNIVQSITTRTPGSSGASNRNLSIQDAQTWFEARSNWLIVFDWSFLATSEDNRAFQELFPIKGTNSRILCISTSRRLVDYLEHPDIQSMQVLPLKPEEARPLLFHELSISSPTEAEAAWATNLINSVRCLPVTIQGMAHRMLAKGQSLEQFLDLELDSYVSKVCNRSLEELRNNDHVEAINFLNIFCLFEKYVPLGMIPSSLGVWQTLCMISKSQPAGPPDLDDTIHILVKMGLIDRGASSIHTLTMKVSDMLEPVVLTVFSNVQKYCVERLRSQGYFQSFLELAIRLFNESFEAAQDCTGTKHESEYLNLQNCLEFQRHGRRLRGLEATCNESEKRDLKSVCDQLNLKLRKLVEM